MKLDGALSSESNTTSTESPTSAIVPTTEPPATTWEIPVSGKFDKKMKLY